MKISLYLAGALIFSSLTLSSCGGEDEKEAIKLDNFKDRISYAMGADHAGQLISADPNFKEYNKEQILKGFEIGLKDENAFGPECELTIQNMLGPTRQGFNPQYNNEGSLCIGKILGSVFIKGWKKNESLDKFDLEKVTLGFNMALNGVDTLIEKGERTKMVQDFIGDISKKHMAKLQRDEPMFFAKIKAKKGVQEVSEGLFLETLTPGKGAKPVKGDDVQVDYAVMNIYGDTIESSLQGSKMGQPAPAFNLNGVYQGWQLAFPSMSKGGIYKLYIPRMLANGQESMVFYIEVHNFGKAGSLTGQKPGM